jgi:hypothetical protein
VKIINQGSSWAVVFSVKEKYKKKSAQNQKNQNNMMGK